MRAEDLSVGGAHDVALSRFARQQFADVAAAEVLAVRAVRRLEPRLARDLAHFRFREFAQGEDRLRENLRPDAVEEVALVLGAVDATKEGDVFC